MKTGIMWAGKEKKKGGERELLAFASTYSMHSTLGGQLCMIIRSFVDPEKTSTVTKCNGHIHSCILKLLGIIKTLM